MEKYSLALCKSNHEEYQILTWNSFELELYNQQINEALIFALDKDANPVSLAKRLILGQLIISANGVKHLDDYCLIDNTDNGRLIPCMILLDADLEYAIAKVLEFGTNKSLIQCFILDDGTFKVNECKIVEYDKRFNLQVN